MENVNKVLYGNEVIIDLSGDTVNENNLFAGVTAHAANGAQITGNVTLGALAALNSINYNSNYLTNKPELGAVAALNVIDYESDFIINKPSFATGSGALSYLDVLDYKSKYLINKPILGTLSGFDFLDYNGSYLVNKPLSYIEMLDLITTLYKGFPKEIITAVYLTDSTLYTWSPGWSYSNETASYDTSTVNYVIGASETVSNEVMELFTSGKFKMADVEDAPSDGKSYSRKDGAWIRNPEMPYLGALSGLNELDYNSKYLTNKPPSATAVLQQILQLYPDLPKSIIASVYATEGMLYTWNPLAAYEDETLLTNLSSSEDLIFSVDHNDEELMLDINNIWFSESNLKSEIDEIKMDLDKKVEGAVGKLDALDYNSEYLVNKPESYISLLERIMEFYPEIPRSILVAMYITEETLYTYFPAMTYDEDEETIANTAVVEDQIAFDSEVEDEILNILISESWFSEKGLRRALDDKANLVDLDSMAFQEDAPYDDRRYQRKNGQWVPDAAATLADAGADKLNLGDLAYLDRLDYESDFLTHKPEFGDLAFQNTVDYESEQLLNKPLLGSLSSMDTLSYESELLTDKPVLGALAALDSIDYSDAFIVNKPVSTVQNGILILP